MLNQSVSQAQASDQLPNNVREALLGTESPKTAVLLDLLFLLGYRAGQRVTMREVIAVTKDYTSQNIAREGLQHDSIKRTKLPSSRRGRPTYTYTLPSLKTLLNELTGGLRSPSDPISIEDCKSLHTYRMALHRELIARGASESDRHMARFSRRYMTRRLNVSEQTLRNYEKELNTYVEPRFDYQPIQSKAWLFIVPETRQHNGQYLQAKHPDGKIIRLPAKRVLAGYYLKLGYQVELWKREVNAYAPQNPEIKYRSGKWSDFVEN